MTNKFISAKENDKDNVNLMGVQGLRGMSHKYKSLTTTILRRALTIKCMKEYLQRYFLCFEKAYFCLEKFLLRSCKNIFQYIYIYILKKNPLFIFNEKKKQCSKKAIKKKTFCSFFTHPFWVFFFFF